MKKQYFVSRLFTMLLFMCIGLALCAAPIQVNGIVQEENGDPLIGASVMVVGKSQGTSTDIDGRFSLSVEEGSLLKFSYVGYQPKTMKATSSMTVTLASDSQMMDEVVVVGYGVQKKSDLTGAISKVESKDIANRTLTSAEQALAGKTSGVQLVSSSGAPGSSASVRIRGYSSNYTSEPLYIVDGMKVPNLSGVDSNDIEEVEVLKDAASAAIYGAEAGNGVILITTKRAKENSAKNGKISYDFQISSQHVSRIPKILNAKDYLQYNLEANVITQNMVDQYYDGITDTDWADMTFENSLMMKHTLGFQKASPGSKLFISLNYETNDGIVKGPKDKTQRLGLTVNAEGDFKPWLTAGVNVSGTYRKLDGINATSGMGGVISSFMKMDPTVKPFYTSETLPSWMATDIANGNPVMKTDDGRYYGYSYFYRGQDSNTLLYRDQQIQKSDMGFVRSMAYLNLKPIKGLVITSRLGLNLYANYSTTVQKSYYVSPNALQNTPMVSTSSPLYTNLQWENFANYNFKIAENEFGVMLGTSYEDNKSRSLSGSVNNLTVEDPLYYFIDFKSADATQTVSGITATTRKSSYFGRINYNFVNRYLAEVSMRADAADLSYLSRKSRWGKFPSVSLGWIASNEGWFPKSRVLDYLKIRGSWGKNGSLANLGNYAYASAILTNAIAAVNGQTTSAGAHPSALGNDNLKWEESEQLDFGIDLRFFNSRLTLTADYFDKKTNGLIISGVSPSLTAGNKPSPMNAGNVSNRGFELDLSWRDMIGGFSYSVTGNLATLRNRVTYLDPTVSRINGESVNRMDGFTVFEKGYPVWYFRGYKFDHIDTATGEPVVKDLDGDGQITSNDREFIGSGVPKLTYGFTITMNYRNFDFLVFANGISGSNLFANYSRLDTRGSNILKRYFDGRWTTEHPDASMPSAAANNMDLYLNSDANVFKGDYFKIKQIQLGYTLPSRIIRATKVLSNVRIYASLDDFFTFTSYPGMDPEIASGNSTTANGIDSGQYPSAKKIVFGLNVTF